MPLRLSPILPFYPRGPGVIHAGAVKLPEARYWPSERIRCSPSRHSKAVAKAKSAALGRDRARPSGASRPSMDRVDALHRSEHALFLRIGVDPVDVDYCAEVDL